MTISWSEYDRLAVELQSQLVQIRLPSGETAWAHRSGVEAHVLPPERVSDAEWATMSPAARWQYARSSSAPPSQS
jgi:hypothetical protein